MANKVSEMFEGLTNNFKGMIDANSVVGEPIIVNDGTMIVPISKYRKKELVRICLIFH